MHSKDPNAMPLHRRNHHTRCTRLTFAAAAFLLLTFQHAFASELTLLGGVSTTNAINEIATLYQEKHGVKVRSAFAATSTIARQIENGAPADVYFAPTEYWVNYLQKANLIKVATREALVVNTLALIAPIGSDFHIKIEPKFKMLEALKGKRLALGDPDHTAIGIVAKDALKYLGVWEDVEPRLARANNNRAAVAMVERGEVGAGIVFTTGAKITKNVKIIDLFPANSHAPVNIFVAQVASSKNVNVEQFLRFMKNPESMAIFEKYGFKPLYPVK